MLRRFESYGFAPHATAEARADLVRVLRSTGAHIPEVLDSAVGHNRSSAAVDLVWEHAYEGPEAYAAYMRHPFHICVLDRYLLPESPECITASRRDLQLGLLGYEVDGAPFRALTGIRRVLAMKEADRATPEAVDGFLARLNARAGAVAGIAVSAAAPNSMGLKWFPDGWTHVWEQVFTDEDAMHASIDEEAEILESGPMKEWIDLWYEIEAGAPATVGTRPRTTEPVEGSVLMVDAVDVPDDAVDRYLDAFERLYLPGARSRGMELLACWQTPAGIGEDVSVTTAFAVGTWADWERMRNAAVGDPALDEWIAARRAVMRVRRRRFVTEPVSPPARRRGGDVPR